MTSQTTAELAQQQEALNQREAALQAKMDHMLNQRRVNMEQESERKRKETTEACRADFCSKNDAALLMYKQKREALERRVRDMEAERTLAEADATIAGLRRDVQRLEEENSASALQGVEMAGELQELRDAEEEVGVLRRQRVQMFRGFSARVLAAVHRLGIHGLTLPTVPEDNGSILRFFSQLAEELDGASAKVLDLVDTECRELLGLAGMRIFSNIQRLRPDLNLEEVLWRPPPPPPGTPDRVAEARAGRLNFALRRLQALYARPGASAPSSSSGEASGSTESSSEEATDSSEGTSSSSSDGADDDGGDAAVAQ
jgi:hypothetical protein